MLMTPAAADASDARDHDQDQTHQEHRNAADGSEQHRRHCSCSPGLSGPGDIGGVSTSVTTPFLPQRGHSQ